MNVRLSGILFLLSILAAFASRPDAIWGCAVAPPLNQKVAIADESAIIIWDAPSKTQHFIRRASFTGAAADFGFLVPTPTKPTLAEAGDEAFSYLAKVTEPKVVTRSRPSSGGGGCIGCGAAADKHAMAPAVGAVRVLEEKRVAGHDAVILEADDADALSKWLTDHGYFFSPALKEWVKPYIAAKWKINAFKIAKDAKEEKDATEDKKAKEPTRMGTAALRMTFQTDKPFFPYREPPPEESPGNPQAPPRLLRVFFIAEAKVKGTIGEKAWPGAVAWANKLATNQREKVLEHLKLSKETPPAECWLTEFEDNSSPRPGTDDVYFSVSEDQTPKERPPHIHYVSRNVPDCVMCYALATYLFASCLVCRLRKK